MASRSDIIIFIHSFAWIFLLSSVIPALLLGRERGVLPQFGVCLTLTFLAFVIQDTLAVFNGALDQILGLAPILQNPLIATAYLSVPYILMVGFDTRTKRKKEKWLKIERENNDFPEDVFTVENDSEEEQKTQEREWAYSK